MVDLLGRPLHPVRQPANDVLGVVGIDLVDVIDPPVGLGGVAGLDQRRAVMVERGDAGPLDPAAGSNEQLVGDQRRLAGAPRHLLDGAMPVEPGAWRNLLQLAVGRRHFDIGQPGVDAGARPRLPARQEKIGAARGVADEVVELDALLGQVVVRIIHAGLEPGRQRGGDRLAALVGEIAVALHCGGERVLHLLRGNPVARHHGAEHEGGLVQRLVAAAGRHGGELGGDPAQRALGIGVLARTGRAVAAWPRAGAALLRRLDQVDDAGRHFGNALGGERGSEVGLASNRHVGLPVAEHCAGRDDVAAGTANVDAGRQAAAAVGQRRPALRK